MKFDDLDARMRVFETAQDYQVLPEIFMVARIDGRGFTKLTKEIHKFEAPYDERFRDIMVDTVCHLMNCGFRIVYGSTQSDEISLLFHRNADAFGRKIRKYNSILASEAGAAFTLKLGSIGTFDCRISLLPTEKLVIDYFRWRQEDASRNALNSHCYWLLRKQGKSVRQATDFLNGHSTSGKNELLFSNGVNFNKIPAWQKRGVGVYWDVVSKEGYNPVSKQATQTTRRQLKVDLQLPMKNAYTSLLQSLIVAATQ